MKIIIKEVRWCYSSLSREWKEKSFTITSLLAKIRHTRLEGSAEEMVAFVLTQNSCNDDKFAKRLRIDREFVLFCRRYPKAIRRWGWVSLFDHIFNKEGGV